MSALSYRSWDIWINTSFFNGQNTYDGYYECTILNTLMVQQSIEFLVEKYKIHNRCFNITFQSSEIVKQVTTTEEGQLCIRVYETFDTSLSSEIAIQSINAFIDSISLSIDAPLLVQKYDSYHNNMVNCLWRIVDL